MEQIKISKTTPSDEQVLREIIIDSWGTDFVVSRGSKWYPLELPKLVAKLDNTIVGLLTYRVEDDECELVTLNSLQEGIGVGTLLIDELVRKAKELGCKRIWVITTNDNIKALAFYQKKGFRLKEVYPNAIEQSRKLKPQIPLIGNNGIPVRDEIELELLLNY